MVLALAGAPLPPLPQIPGRVHGVAPAERVDTLLKLTFGEDHEGKVRRLYRSPDVLALLDDP